MLFVLSLGLLSSASGQELSYNLDEFSEELLNSSNAIVQFDKTDVFFEKHTSYTAHYSKAVTVLNEKAEHHLQFAAFYKEGSDKVFDVEIRVFNKHGKLISGARDKFLTDMAAGDGYSIAGDGRVKLWGHKATDYPITFHYSYKVTSKNTLALPLWAPLAENDLSVMQSDYSLHSNLPVQLYPHNFDAFPTIEKTENGFRMRDQPSLNKEKYSPGLYSRVPMLFSNPEKYVYQGIDGEQSSWSTYGKWIYSAFLADQQPFVKQSVLKEIGGLIHADDDKKSIAQKLYRYVQENTRYVSITLEDGGLKPLSPLTVHEKKYGDCKALSFYYKKLLELYDIPSDYVIIHAGTSETVDLLAEKPGIRPGNHIIVQIPLPNDTLWVDCTSSDNPFDYLGSFTDDRVAFVLQENGGYLTRTPSYDAENLKTIESEILVTESGRMEVREFQFSHGLFMESEMAISKKTNEEQETYILEDDLSKLNKVDITSLAYSLDKQNKSAKRELSFQTEEALEKAGEYCFLPLDFMKLDIPRLPKNHKRQNDIIFERARSEKQIITITIPSNYELIESVDLSSENAVGLLEFRIQQTDATTIEIEKTFSLNKGNYDKSTYAEIKSFLDQCIKQDSTPVTFKIK